MIRVKDIQKHFKVFREDNGKRLMLNHLTEYGRLTPSKYVGHVDKHKEGWYFAPGFNPTSNIVQLLIDIEEFQKKTFKYDSEFYNPRYRPGFFVESVVANWLYEHDFSWGNCYSNVSSYKLKRQNIYGLNRDSVTLSFTDLETCSYELKETPDNLPKEVEISLHTGNFDYRWVSIKTKRTCEAIIEGIEDLLKPLLLVDASSDLKTAEKLDVHELNAQMKKLSGWNITEKSIKADLIKQLEETLAILKNSENETVHNLQESEVH